MLRDCMSPGWTNRHERAWSLDTWDVVVEMNIYTHGNIDDELICVVIYVKKVKELVMLVVLSPGRAISG